MIPSLTQKAFTPVRHFTREINIDREAFIGQLPSAIPHQVFTLRGDLIRISEKSGSVWIGMTTLVRAHQEQTRAPMMRLDFAFDGLSESEIEEFMASYSVVANKRCPKLPFDRDDHGHGGSAGTIMGTGGVPGRS
jgi:hypothetical protein